MSEGWRTKKDVIEDLRFATGSYNHEINEEHVIRGEQPPPRLTICEDVDEEILRLYGGLGPIEEPATPESDARDFTGITTLLRIVDDYYEKPSVQQYNQKPSVSPDNEQNMTDKDTLLSMTKLNPNVPEYVPKVVSSVEVALNENKKPDKNSTTSTAKATNVQQYNQKPSVSPDNEQNMTDKDTLLSMTKLNPNVPAYVPIVVNSVEVGLNKYENKKADQNSAGSTEATTNVEQNNEKRNVSPDNKRNVPEIATSLSISKLDPNVPEYTPRVVNSLDVGLNNNILPDQSCTASTAKLNPNVPEYTPRVVNSLDVGLNNNKKPDQSCTASTAKLNPNVPEYTPRVVNSLDVGLNITKKPDQSFTASTVATTNITSETSEFNIANNVNIVKETNKADNISSNSHRVDVSKLTDAEVKDMREKLKQKIKNTSNEKCVKKKRERNLAMATLVKLHCASQTNDLKPPKLLGPAYFERSISEQKEIVNDSQNPETDNSVVKKGLQPFVDNDAAKPRILDNNTTENNSTAISARLIDRNIQSVKPSTSGISVKDSAKIEEVKSIEKVEDWLDSQEEVLKVPKAPKARTLYLGPVTYKSKAKPSRSNVMSPNSTISENTNNSVDPVEAYVPTEYADQLIQEYEARKKAKQIAEGNIWTKLELQLKEKDEQIKKRMQNSNTSLST